MSKLIAVAGYSRKNNELKFRTANDIKRAAQLEALGDTHVNMITLPKPMSKEDAAKYLLTTNFSKGNAEVDALFTANSVNENPFAKVKVTKPKVAKKAPTVKVTKAPEAAMSFVADAPMSSKQAAKIRAEFMKKLKAVYEAN